ncbi:distal membrane arm assembly component 2 [Rhynchophorus ferrugineus]|uniref:distal membrane arm assembly component 2 n=1 Tax=Rhynchophorus ferrugineus TaxID=354439 RepID=UPI003FCD5462
MNALNLLKSNKIQRTCSFFQQQGCKLCTKPDNQSPPKKPSAITPHRAPVVRRTIVPRRQPRDISKWHEEQGEHWTFLRNFYDEDNNVNLMKLMHTPIDLRFKSIGKWLVRQQESEEIYLQHYVPQRQKILGPDLAAAHFLLHRGGAVKFQGQNKWIKAINGNYELPNTYEKEWILEAIDCTDMNLYYEGLTTLRELQNLQWLSLNGCSNIDDFCIDVISNVFSNTLIYLDLRNCYNISERGIGALYKMNNLKILYLDDLLKDTKYELTCLLLQDLNPQLVIKSDVVNFEIS